MSARPRAALRASLTSDEGRVRPLFWASAAAALATLGALAFGPDPRVPGPVSRPHARAGISCAQCHGGEGAAQACTTCHGPHASTRAGHRALAARGALGCASCHSVHGGEGVTFEADRRVVVWGPGGERVGTSALSAPAGVTVPLLSARACATCHALESPTDPLARCVAGGHAGAGSWVTCFDEHSSSPGGPSRLTAWEAARTVAVTVAPPPSRSSAAPWGWTFGAAGIGALAFAAFARPRTSRKRANNAAPAPPPRVRLPVINASTCLGCSACVDACPFDVLEIDRFFAVVARPEACCGAVVCAEACPNGSLRIAEGELAPERPRVNQSLESLDTPGLYLAGDLTGLPLIRNAMRQGASVAEHLAATTPREHPELDLVIIGAGPAGLSAALRAQELGLRVACLEQGAFAESLRSFPRGKVVFDLPGATPLEGPLWRQEATKEELSARWTHAVRAAALDVREQRKVTGVERDPSGFVVTAARPDGSITRVRGARVLLAIGRRGTPRTLPMRVSPGCEGRVSYALADAAAFAGRHVIVVGLGDTAIEAALALSQQPGTTVTVVHRGESFTRGKARNVAAIRARVAKKAIALRFGTALEALEPQGALLRTSEGTERIPCDAVLVLIGGEPSWNLVRLAGVKLAREA